MKTLLTILLLSIVSFSMGQKKTKDALTPKDYFLTTQSLPLTISNEPPILTINAMMDTVTILSPKIKFIKIDGKVFEIVRSVDIKLVVPLELKGSGSGWYFPMGTITPTATYSTQWNKVDTAVISNPVKH